MLNIYEIKNYVIRGLVKFGAKDINKIQKPLGDSYEHAIKNGLDFTFFTIEEENSKTGFPIKIWYKLKDIKAYRSMDFGSWNFTDTNVTQPNRLFMVVLKDGNYTVDRTDENGEFKRFGNDVYAFYPVIDLHWTQKPIKKGEKDVI